MPMLRQLGSPIIPMSSILESSKRTSKVRLLLQRGNKDLMAVRKINLETKERKVVRRTKIKREVKKLKIKRKIKQMITISARIELRRETSSFHRDSTSNMTL